MAAEVFLKGVREDLIVGGDPIGDVLGLAEFGEGSPAGVDDVDEHEGFGGGAVDEDVAWFVVGAFVGELEGLVA